MSSAEWEPEAENWVRWARTPGVDAYWHYRDAFFDTILPPAGRRTLEIGCGEGRVARDLVAAGHRVLALDTSPTLLHYARAEDPASRYLAATGSTLPFPDGAFDIVVAYNALQVVDDMAATVHEAARVLELGGHLCFCIAHPVTDLGGFRGDAADAGFLVRRDYFERVRVEDAVERSDGATMTFRGWTYSLEAYAIALEDSGFAIEAMREPRPAQSAQGYERWHEVPLFLNVRARKGGASGE